MSMYRYDYIVLGYDLMKYEREIRRYFDKLEEEKKYYIIDDMYSQQSIGNIQLFDDPVGSAHLIYGLVICMCDQYDGFMKPIDLGSINSVDKQDEVFGALQENFEEAFDCKEFKNNAHLIVFTEWR